MLATDDPTTITESAAADEPTEPTPMTRDELLRGAARSTVVFLASRVAVLLAMGVAGVVREQWPMRRALAHWDGGWYLSIADSGYARGLPPAGAPGSTNIAFFPLFPTLVRAASQMTGLSTFRSAVLLNVAFGLAAAVLLWVLARRLGDAAFADRAVAMFAFFPASFVLTMVYSEAVMLALAVACLYALVRHRWLLAGVTAAITTAARPNAVALCFACAVGAGLAIWQRREWRALVAPALSPLGLIGFFAFLQQHTGDLFIWNKAQASGWGQGFDGGWAMVKAAGRQVVHPFTDLNEVTAGLSMVFVVVALILLIRWKPPAVLTTYAVVVIALGYLSPALSSRPRFAMTAFPLVMAVAWSSRRSFPVVLGTSATVLGAFCIISVSTLAITP
jgi:hypothetical protein